MFYSGPPDVIQQTADGDTRRYRGPAEGGAEGLHSTKVKNDTGRGLFFCDICLPNIDQGKIEWGKSQSNQDKNGPNGGIFFCDIYSLNDTPGQIEWRKTQSIQSKNIPTGGLFFYDVFCSSKISS